VGSGEIPDKWAAKAAPIHDKAVGCRFLTGKTEGASRGLGALKPSGKDRKPKLNKISKI